MSKLEELITNTIQKEIQLSQIEFQLRMTTMSMLVTS